MNPDTEKLILGLNETQHSLDPVPIAALYVLEYGANGVEEEIRLRPLNPAAAFVKLVENTFNYRVAGRDRLSRQFKENASLATMLNVRELVYPRTFDRIAEVRDRILQDVREVLACR